MGYVAIGFNPCKGLRSISIRPKFPQAGLRLRFNPCKGLRSISIGLGKKLGDLIKGFNPCKGLRSISIFFISALSSVSLVSIPVRV